jgi:hypothetical protein
MPGSKRKQDEDTWLIFQSKKCKKNQLSERIYESTLAKLRHGARAFFSPHQGSNEPPNWAIHPEGQTSGQPTVSNVNANMRNIHLTGVQEVAPSRNINAALDGIPVCSECQWNGSMRGKTYFEKCNFCDKPACHVSPCASCGDYFCQNCCIRRYDDPSEDKVVCFSCLP